MTALSRPPAPVEDDEILGHPILWPSRWPVIAGTALAVVGTFLPWQVVTFPIGAPETRTGAGGADDPGVQILVFVFLTCVLVGSRAVAASRTRTLQLAPAVIGAIGFLFANQDYAQMVPGSVLSPGAASEQGVQPGFWVAFIGALLVTVGGVATTISIVRSRPPHREGAVGADFSFVPPLVGAISGFVLAVVALESLQGGAALVAVVAAVGVALLVNLVLGVLWRRGGARSTDRAAATRRRPAPPVGPDDVELEHVRPVRRE